MNETITKEEFEVIESLETVKKTIFREVPTKEILQLYREIKGVIDAKNLAETEIGIEEDELLNDMLEENNMDKEFSEPSIYVHHRTLASTLPGAETSEVSVTYTGIFPEDTALKLLKVRELHYLLKSEEQALLGYILPDNHDIA